MKQYLRRVTACVLACLLVLTAVPQRAYADYESDLEIVMEDWGKTESSFAVRYHGEENVQQISVCAAVFRGSMFCGCAFAETNQDEDGLFRISVPHLPFETNDSASVRVFLLDAETLSPLSTPAETDYTFDGPADLPDEDSGAVAPLGVKRQFPELEAVAGASLRSAETL